LLPEKTYETNHFGLGQIRKVGYSNLHRVVINPVNHYRRIKRAYKRDGIDAVKFYFKLQGVKFMG